MNTQERIREAGVVGAGGAGFPAHVKAGASAEIVIGNGAECEPLMHKDSELMRQYPQEVVAGLKLLMKSTGARKGFIGVKKKNAEAISALESTIHGDGIQLHLLDDFYPSGDEYTLVFDVTGRLIPPQGIPIDIGVVVNNTETLYNIARATEGHPVTEKFITVAGAVKHPGSFVVPVGLSYKDAIRHAGGVTSEKPAVFVGGLLMGKLEYNLDLPITKTTGGLIVLPAEHPMVRRMNRQEHAMHRIGKSACDQCSYCTELCPRYLLGYDVQPHKVMRSLAFTKTGEDVWNQYAVLCCACGLCTLYSCPEDLYPKEACDAGKRTMKEKGMAWSGSTEVVPHPMFEGRRTPLKRLIKRLAVEEYDCRSEFFAGRPEVKRVEIPLSQHVGTPASPLVQVGDRVEKGQCIGEPPPQALGARIHASIDGTVRSVGETITIDTF